MKSERKPWLGWLLVFASSLLFGLNASTTKVLVEFGFSPSFIVPFRSSATALMALIVVLAIDPRRLKVSWRQLAGLAAFGIIGVALMQWSYTNAVSRLPVGISLLIEYTSAIWLPLINWVFFNRPAKRALWLGVFVAMAGLVLVSNIWAGSLNGLGLVFAGMTAILVTCYFLMAERIQAKRDVWSTLFYSMAFSAAFWWIVQPPALGSLPNMNGLINLGGNLANTTVPVWLAIAWLAILGSFTPMAFNYIAIRNIDSTSMGIGSLAEVLFAFLFGWLWLAEDIKGIQVIGSLFVLAGIVVAQMATKAPREAIE